MNEPCIEAAIDSEVVIANNLLNAEFQSKMHWAVFMTIREFTH